MDSFIATQIDLNLQEMCTGFEIDGSQSIALNTQDPSVQTCALRCVFVLSLAESSTTIERSFSLILPMETHGTDHPQNPFIHDVVSLTTCACNYLPRGNVPPSPLDVLSNTLRSPLGCHTDKQVGVRVPHPLTSKADSSPPIVRKETTEKRNYQDDRKDTVEKHSPKPILFTLAQSVTPKWIHPLGSSLPYFHQDQDSSSKHHWEETEETESIGKNKKITALNSTDEGSSSRPLLEPPKMGIFAVYYILTKLGILSDAASHWESKQSIEATDAEMKELYQARIAELKKSLEYEKANKIWGLTLQMMNWMMALTGVIAGITLVISGIGVIAGALLIAGGILALTNQIFEVTGVWNKIAEKLPTDSQEKREAVLHWMRIGVTVLCLVLSCAGAIGAGWSALNQAMGNFMAVFGGVIMIGSGVCTIGQGITLYLHKDRFARSLAHQRRLSMLKHRREDLVDTLDHGVDRMKQLFIDLAKLLDFEAEIVRANQAILGHGS